MNIVRELVQRADSWVNAMTGLGTLRDKLMHAQVVPGSKLTDPVLEALFNDDDVARRVVGKLPRDATRRGFYLEIQELEAEANRELYPEGEPEPEEGGPDPEAAKKEAADIERKMMADFAELEAMPKLRDGWIWARLYGGGSGVFVGADDGLSVDQPLNEQAIRSIKFLNVVKRPQLSVFKRYEDIREPKYGQPEQYNVSQTHGLLLPREGLTIHESRLILFDGALTACMTQDTPSGFDDSVLQSAYTPLQQTATAWQSVAHLMTDASQGVLKIANLVDLVAAGGAETLRSRIQLMDLARSVCRAILVDAEKESFERVGTSFAGLPEVMDKLMMRMSAAAEQPVTLLYGRSAAGLNATGESDIRGWYDTVAEGQTDELKPRLERLLKLMFLAKASPTRGRLPAQWCIEFNPLWLPTDKEEADTKKVKADTYVALVTGNIMTDAEAGIGLAPDFPEIDVESRTDLAEADKEEGVRPREVNTPPAPDPNDPEGGGGSTVPKADSSQPRVPAGSPRGGQWTSGGGGGGVPTRAAAPAGGGLSEAQRESIRKHGTAQVMTSLQQKLVQRYGVPAKQAALLFERDIKAQLKAAKIQRGEERLEKRALAGKAGLKAQNAGTRKANEEARNIEEGAAETRRKQKAAADAEAKRKERNQKQREARAKRKAESKRAEEAKRAEETKRAEQAKKAPATLEDIGKAASLQDARAVTTRVVQSYLGLEERHASGTSISHQDLSAKRWGGYNQGGNIVLDSKQAEALRKPPRHADDAKFEAEINTLQARRTELARAQKGDRETPEQIELREKVMGVFKERHAAAEHREALLVMTHEELHSFGPTAKRSWLYVAEGRVAEEVATEVLARDIVRGPGRKGSGAYQKQISGVLDAMHAASKDKKRGYDEHHATLVEASKAYKRNTSSYDAMRTLADKMHGAAPEKYDVDKLWEKLKAVPEPR